MSKSKSKRKEKKKKASSVFPFQKKILQSNKSAEVTNQFSQRPSVLSLMTGKYAKAICRIVFASPLFIGALVAKGSPILAPKLFLLFLLLLIISSFWFRHFSEFRSVKHLLIFVTLLCLHMGTFAVLGVYSQFPELSIGTAVLGLLPGFLLSAAFLAKHSSLLESAGFKRSRLHLSKKGLETTRPGGATRLFTTFLMLLPGLVIIAGIFSVLPIYFLLVAIVLIRTPNLAQAFQDQTIEDQSIYLGVLRLALLATVLMLVAGFFSRA